jgi:hypothetical protein
MPSQNSAEEPFVRDSDCSAALTKLKKKQEKGKGAIALTMMTDLVDIEFHYYYLKKQAMIFANRARERP